ncbi:unnamed protein product [Peniophora sp. CBMAI 1063]|nr:unnamed protein product [Peniophora sp. CBMAI 1063]
MGRTKTQGRKVVALSSTSSVPAKATAERETSPDRPPRAIPQINKCFSSAKRVKSSLSKPAKSAKTERVKKATIKRAPIRAPGMRSRFFPRPKPPPLPEEDMDLRHMQDATELARKHVGHKPIVYNEIADLVRTEEGFAVFLNDMLEAYESLRDPTVRPVLIQECFKKNPFLMVVAVIFLNKTSATVAIPAFCQVIERWKTPKDFAQADRKKLFKLIEHLGLGNTRSDGLIKLGKLWLEYPPVTTQSLQEDPTRARAQRTINAKMARKKNPKLFRHLSDEDMPAIAHLPLVGQYAVDSYKMFCCGEEDWKSVRPNDKELARYVMWRWALLGKAYDMVDRHPWDHITPNFINAVIRELVDFSPYKALDKLVEEERALERGSARIVLTPSLNLPTPDISY